MVEIGRTGVADHELPGAGLTKSQRQRPAHTEDVVSRPWTCQVRQSGASPFQRNATLVPIRAAVGGS
jgi:hypothetical protein